MSLEQADLFVKWKEERKQFVSQIVLNFKEWEVNRKDVLHEYCRNISSGRLLRDSDIDLVLVGENLGTLEGSGCAIINTLMNCDTQNLNESSLALLAAGEGSRLWGVSASNGFIKAFTVLFSDTLLEQTIEQCGFLLSKAPRSGNGFVFIAGTDNILLPSQELCAVNGKLFNTVQNGHLFYFAKEVPLLDYNGDIIDESRLDAMEQLGVMFVDEETSAPIEFLEKIPKEQILNLLKENNKSSVFFNAFYFLCSKEAAEFFAKEYSIGDDGNRIFERKDFDWSGHILEPLSIVSSGDKNSKDKWRSRWNEKQKRIFPNEDEWMLLFDIAKRFVDKFGNPVVLSLGTESEWYDTGLCEDLYKLHQNTIIGEESKKEIIRKLLSVPSDNITNCKHTNEFSVSNNSIIMNCTFKGKSTIGENCIIINSIFNTDVDIPDGVIIMNSKFEKGLSFSNEITKTLVYSYLDEDKKLEVVHDKSVYFSITSKNNEIITGSFPIEVIPKNKESETTPFNYYNIGDNLNKSYLEQRILGTEYSFRELQKQSIPTLSLKYLSLMD